MALRPGIHICDLDRRITIRQRTTAPNAFGEPVETWTDLATCWAQKRDLTAKEIFAGRREVGEAATVFTIRWRGDVTRTHRVVHEGADYDIESITEMGVKEFLQLLCRAQVD